MSNDKSIIIIITILLQSLFIIMFNLFIYTSTALEYVKHFLPFANFIVLLLTILVILSIREVGKNIQIKTEKNLLRVHLAQIQELVDSLQSQRHEHTRHLQTIQAMLYLESFKEARDYIDGIAENYGYTQDMIYVGNSALTILFNSKKKVAEMKNIDFDFAIKCDLNNFIIPSWDLCSILGNLLDNAFETVIANKGIRRVGLEIKKEDNHHVIYVYNNGPSISEKKKHNLFKPGYTTKDSQARGYGLFVVKKLVEEYNGNIEVRSKERTVFILYFPIKEGDKNGKNIVQENCL